MMGRDVQARTIESRRRCASAVLRSCAGRERRRVGWPSSLRWPRRAWRWQARQSTSCQSFLLPAGTFVRRSHGHFSPSPSISQMSNKQLSHVCISDASTKKAHTKYRLLRFRLPPGFPSPNPYLSSRARAHLSFPYRKYSSLSSIGTWKSQRCPYR
jgi:hypothetical protein